MRSQVQSLAPLSGLRIKYCHELQCRSQMQLRSGVTVAVASSYSSDSTPSLGECSPKKQKIKNTKKKRRRRRPVEAGWGRLAWEQINNHEQLCVLSV